MKVKLLTGMAGAGFAHSPGDELEVGVDLSKADADRMIERGMAEQVGAPRETASTQPSDRAASGKTAARKATDRRGGGRSRSSGSARSR